MRICYLAQGKFLHVDPYLDYFSEQGHEVYLVALSPGSRRQKQTREAAGQGNWVKYCGKLAYLPAMLRARRVVRSLDPDIVHGHYATSGGLAGWVCGWHPWIVTAHGTDLEKGIKRGTRRKLLRHIMGSADLINPVSERLRQIVLSLGVPAKKIAAFTLGVDTRTFRFARDSRAAASSRLNLICTRWLEPIYDHETIIRSMAILKACEVDFRLTLLGRGTRERDLQALAKREGVGDKIIFGGCLPNEQLAQQLARHHVYLSASRSDGTSLSLLEAMAVGLYPIVSDISANREWLKHGINGLLHTPGDSRALADCILSYAAHGCGDEGVLVRNRELIVEKGDRTRNMQHLEELYINLIQARPATRVRAARAGLAPGRL